MPTTVNDDYIEISYNGVIILSTVPGDLRAEVDNCDTKAKCFICPVRNKIKRQKKVIFDDGYIYACSYNPEMTNKLFLFYFESVVSLSSAYINRISDIKSEANRNLRRMKHNISRYHTIIKEELDSFLSTEDVQEKEWPVIVQNTTNEIHRNSKLAASIFLHTRKNIQLAISEMDAYDVLVSEPKSIALQSHEIHKVVMLSLQPFIGALTDKKVSINLGQCAHSVKINYDSFSVALGHFWDNATKYTVPDTTIDIVFDSNQEYVIVTISMNSLAFKEKEMNRLFEEGFSGSYARSLSLSGNGIGLFYIKKIMELNGGDFGIAPGKSNYSYNGYPYSYNSFIIKLKKE